MVDVVIIGPPPGAAGGIGLMMQHLKSTLPSGSSYTFLDSGTTDHRYSSFLKTIKYVLMKSRDSKSIFHLNIASRGSTYRKAIIAILLWVTKRKYVLHLHGAAYREFYRDSNPWVQLLVRTIFRRAARVLVLGVAWHGFVTESLGVHTSRVGILPNAVPGPMAIPDRSESHTTMLFLGRSGVRKGTTEIIEALKGLRTTSGWTMKLAGDTEDLATRDKLVASPLVDYTGWLDQEELALLLTEASIFVLPSHAEGLPLSLLDAMAWGLAPIVTDVGSISDAVVEGSNGCFVSVGDSNGLRDAMQLLIDDGQHRRRVGRNARQTWEQQFDISEYRPRLESEYATALDMESRFHA